nr:olfactory receptor 52N4-like [Pelodiscus sinensis]|eukprot:XP_006131017.1 olfactory receptor 52N4-like [Pelodiscus sinensis]
MAAFNLTPTEPLTFMLMGIPDLEAAHVWISIPIFLSYMIGLLGNCTLLVVVGKEQTLHKPMYLLICMLALVEIGVTTCIVPKAMWVFWFNLRDIIKGGCFSQTFFFHTAAVMHSAVLVIMAFDRYVAICNPLRYTTILSNTRIAKFGLVGLTRAVLFILPMPLLLNRLPFCDNRIIPSTYCDHMSVAKISCGDITVNRMYGLVITFLVFGFDLMLIALSYSLIIRAVFILSSREAHQKALNTCTAHVSVTLMSYLPGFISAVTHRFGEGIAPYVHVILANLYFLIPPMLNPIVYGVKNKELRDKMGKYTCRK